MPELSIVIPIYNASDIVEESIQELDAFLSHKYSSYEILLRDDGSQDRSPYLLEQLANQYPNVRYFYNRTNVGLGFTLRELFVEAKGKAVVYSDCDLPFGVKAIDTVVQQLQQHDLVVASRYRGASNSVDFMRKLTSRGYYIFCKALFKIPVVDIGSGLVAIKARPLNSLNLNSIGFDIHAELFVKASRAGFSIGEIPIESRKGALNTFSIIKHGPKTVLETIRLRKSLVC